jgi:hypothetical protein
MSDSSTPTKGENVVETVSGLEPHPARDAEPNLDGAFAEDGVDLTLIRWMLGLNPTERLQAAQNLIDAAWKLRTESET